MIRFPRVHCFTATINTRFIQSISALLFVAVLALPATAWSQAGTADEAALRAEQQRLFDVLQQRPDDLDAMFNYAVVSIRLRDYEQAIATLERILIYRDDLPKVKLELGSAYFRLGSYEVARFYFDEVLDANPPPELRARVEEFLAEIQRRSQQSRFAGSFNFGVVYSSNANLGPSERGVDVFGIDAELDPQFVKQGDVGFRAGARLFHRYDLGRPNADAWISDAAIGTLHYVDETDGDLDVVAASTGPRLALSDKSTGPLIRPFVDGTYIRSGGDYLYSGGGAGIEFEAPLDGDTLLFSTAGARYRDYTSDEGENDGMIYYAEAGAQHRFESGTILRGAAIGVRGDADEGFASRVELGARLVAIHDYAPGVKIAAGQPWSITAFGTVIRRWYDDPDPGVDPNTTRHDLDARVGVGHLFRFPEGWALSVEASYFDRGSNIRNFRLDNFEVGALVIKSF